MAESYPLRLVRLAAKIKAFLKLLVNVPYLLGV